MTVLLTGATGALGGLLARDLLARGADLRLLVRTPARADALVRAGRAAGVRVEVVRGDLADPATLRPAFAGVRRAMLVSIGGPPEERVRAHRHFLDAASGAEQVVYLSALGVGTAAEGRGRPPFPAHARTEADLRVLADRTGAAVTALRPALYAETLLRHADRIATGALLAPAGAGRVAFVTRADIAAVAAAVLTAAVPEHAGAVLPVTGPVALSHADVAAILTDVLGHPVVHRNVPTVALRAFALAKRLPAWQRAVALGNYAAVRAGDLDVVTDTVERVAARAATPFAAWAATARNAFTARAAA